MTSEENKKPITIRCLIGFHVWSRWVEDGNGNYYATHDIDYKYPTGSYFYQARECLACGKKQRRKYE